MEAFANTHTCAANENVRFEADESRSSGSDIVINAEGTVFTIERAGIYHVEWNVNLSATTPAGVVGILENGAMLSGAASSGAGCLASGTIIHVTNVPYSISLHNFANEINIENPAQWENSAASIRIVRFADNIL